MKKRIILYVTFIAVAGIQANAQNNEVTNPQRDKESLVAAPPIPPLPPIPPVIDKTDFPLPPLPPSAPILPEAPAENISLDCPELLGPEIINNNGYEICVRARKGRQMVIVKKENREQKIKLSTWNANRKFYEKKYGQLPPQS